MNIIEINYQAKQNYPPIGENATEVPSLRNLIEAILQVLNVENKEISLLFCENKEMQQLNHQYRQKNYATDVLAFESDSDDYLGDIAISLEKTLEQATEYQVPFAKELQRLLIHGILHLLGYDHETSAEDELIMREKEEKIFQEVENTHIC